MKDFPEFLNGFARNERLKDRMKTTILKAKQHDKETFTKILAAEFIKIANEL